MSLLNDIWKLHKFSIDRKKNAVFWICSHVRKLEANVAVSKRVDNCAVPISEKRKLPLAAYFYSVVLLDRKHKVCTRDCKSYFSSTLPPLDEREVWKIFSILCNDNNISNYTCKCKVKKGAGQMFASIRSCNVISNRTLENLVNLNIYILEAPLCELSFIGASSHIVIPMRVTKEDFLFVYT